MSAIAIRAEMNCPAGASATQAISEASDSKGTTATTKRHIANRRTAIAQEGEPRIVRACGRRHTRLKTSVPFVPPKPKLFLTA